MVNLNFKPIIREFHEKDFEQIEKFDKDFNLVQEDCKKYCWIYVAVYKEIVGYIAIMKGQESAYFDDDLMNWAEIRELHIKPEFQNRGVGTLITEFAINDAKNKGFSCIYVSTDDFNAPARQVYKKCGFKEFNRVIRYKYELY
ncbi:MAG: GNAT family N-acetyltransferase [Promethearchaeota archaeon]